MASDGFSLPRRVADLVNDQIKLVSLEWAYEKKLARRRLVALGAVILLASLAFVLLQVALIVALATRMGSVAGVCAVLSLVYGGVGFWVFHQWGRRDPKIGRPFHGTRRELAENIRWIEKLFS